MKELSGRSIRPFIGAVDYQISQAFYRELGFEELLLDDKMSLYRINDSQSFYLQDYYVREWVENTILVWEIDDARSMYTQLHSLRLYKTYRHVKLP